MRFRSAGFVAVAALTALSAFPGCGTPVDPGPGSSGSSGMTGGLTSSGGLGSGGATNTGGTTTSMGGAPSMGGTTPSTGGTTTNTGGVTSTGGLGGSGGTTTGSGGSSSGGVSGGGSSGSSSGGAGGGIPATFDTLKLVIKEVPCLGAGCHNDDQNPLNMKVDDQLYTRLTTHISKNCGDLPIVNPGKPQESAIVKILKGPCGVTPRMPMGCKSDDDGTCVPNDYIAAISQWIANGAPK